MIITEPKVTKSKSYAEISVCAIHDRFPFRRSKLWIRVPSAYGESLQLTGDPWVPAALIPSMICEERLRIEAPVSEKLLQAVPAIEAYFRDLLPQTRTIEVDAPVFYQKLPSGPAAGCFFSGGVDSFYSVLKDMELHREDEEGFSHLLFIAGFDIKLKKRAHLERVRAHLQEASKALGKTYLELSTNLKVFGDRYAGWKDYGGCVLAASGLALSPLLRKVAIPSSFALDQLALTSSIHPDLDPLWSNERTRFVHDGCEVKRVEKIMNQICRSDLALQHLRVCWRTRDVFYNCGICEKCLRTMLALYLGTGKTEFPLFSARLNPETIRRAKISGRFALGFIKENLEVLEQRTGIFDLELKEALGEVYRRIEMELGAG